MLARYARRTVMGWFHDDAPGCEGYIVGLVREGSTVRELRYPDDDKPTTHLHAIQVACECGWRSSRFHAPPRADYAPFTVDLNDEAAENEARDLWREHAHGKKPTRLRPSFRIGLHTTVR